MTTVTRLPINPTYRSRYSDRTGFSLDDPDRRVPIRGQDLALSLASKAAGRENRADQLLKDRGLAAGKNRARSMAWLSPLAGLLGWPERAQAHDHHPPLLTPPDPLSHPGWSDWLANLLAQIPPIDLGQPIFGLALGAALLMTQAIGIRQRSALLKSVTARLEPPQPDLFPDSLPEVEPDAAHKPRFIWKSDAATRQGKVRKENQDAVLVIRFDDGTVALIVCDGAGGIEGGREASTSAVETIRAELQRLWDEAGSLSLEALKQGIAAARDIAQVKDLDGVTTALVALLQQDEMCYATLGDGAVAVIWPDGMVGQVQVPHHTAGQPSNIINAYVGHGCAVPPRVGRLRLEPGAIVMAMSDGASDLFPFDDFALNRDQYPVLDGLAGRLLQTLEEARDPDSGAFLHSDNLTLALARLHEGGGNDEEH